MYLSSYQQLLPNICMFSCVCCLYSVSVAKCFLICSFRRIYENVNKISLAFLSESSSTYDINYLCLMPWFLIVVANLTFTFYTLKFRFVSYYIGTLHYKILKSL